MNASRLLLLSPVVALVLTGCHVSTHDHENGNKVDIGTPFGSLHVKTNTGGAVAGLGITPYPGSVPYKSEKNDSDTDSADVNMSFGNFHLGVRAASYKTADGEDPVIAFYKKDLGRYGDVLECRNDQPVGEPTHTSQGLSCSENHNYHHSTIHTGNGLELRAGSPQHQHIVALEEKDGGTKIGLVALDLPEHHDSSDRE